MLKQVWSVAQTVMGVLFLIALVALAAIWLVSDVREVDAWIIRVRDGLIE